MDQDNQAPPAKNIVLTREFLRAGHLEEFVRRANPEARVLTAAERAASLRAVLEARPDHGSGVLVFAYGSLIWNPSIHIIGRELAEVHGWHRSFCLATKGGRGDATTPGMMLGLEEGGTCIGAVLRVAEAAVEEELGILWCREMVSEGYIPRWLDVTDMNGASLGKAIGFTINRAGPNYEGNLPQPELIRRLAHASGRLGTAADYLFNTCEGLRKLGITDSMLEELAHQVAIERSRNATDPHSTS